MKAVEARRSALVTTRTMLTAFSAVASGELPFAPHEELGGIWPEGHTDQAVAGENAALLEGDLAICERATAAYWSDATTDAVMAAPSYPTNGVLKPWFFVNSNGCGFWYLDVHGADGAGRAYGPRAVLWGLTEPKRHYYDEFSDFSRETVLNVVPMQRVGGAVAWLPCSRIYVDPFNVGTVKILHPFAMVLGEAEQETYTRLATLTVQFVLKGFAFWNQKLLAAESHQFSRGMRAPGSPNGVNEFQVMTLRRTEGSGEATGRGTKLTHRHRVSAHWRDQWYPSTRSHAPKLVRSYVKGPAGTPLVPAGEKVYSVVH